MHDTTAPALDKVRLDRRGFLRRSALGVAIPAALAAVGLRKSEAAAQSAEATPATPPTQAESGYAPVNGLNLYYEIQGTGNPLILLHGGLGTTEMFGQLTPPLAQTRQVIAVDLQAHGHTADIDRPFSFELMADDIAALIAHLGLERADVFGFSLGGGVALQTAIRYPEVVRKLVIASAVYRRDGWHPDILAAMAQMNAEAAAAMVGTPFHGAYARVAPRPEDWPTLVAKLGQLLAQDYDWTDAVRSITAPALLVVGDSDNVRPAHALELFELLGGGVPGDLGGFPSSQLAVLPHAAHSAPPAVLDRADLLLPIVPPFLDAPMPEAT